LRIVFHLLITLAEEGTDSINIFPIFIWGQLHITFRIIFELGKINAALVFDREVELVDLLVDMESFAVALFGSLLR
jgi:hypothetical protein